MLRPIALIYILLTLAACGADGEPEPPTRTALGLTVSGTAEVGIAGTN